MRVGSGHRSDFAREEEILRRQLGPPPDLGELGRDLERAPGLLPAKGVAGEAQDGEPPRSEPLRERREPPEVVPGEAALRRAVEGEDDAPAEGGEVDRGGLGVGFGGGEQGGDGREVEEGGDGMRRRRRRRRRR